MLGRSLGYSENLSALVTANSEPKKHNAYRPSLISIAISPSSLSSSSKRINPQISPNSCTTSHHSGFPSAAAPSVSACSSLAPRFYTASPDLEWARVSLAPSDNVMPSRRGAVRYQSQDSINQSLPRTIPASMSPFWTHNWGTLLWTLEGSRLPSPNCEVLQSSPDSQCGRRFAVSMRTGSLCESIMTSLWNRSVEGSQIPYRESSNRHSHNTSEAVNRSHAIPYLVTQPIWPATSNQPSEPPAHSQRTSFYQRQQAILDAQMQVQHRRRASITELDGAPVMPPAFSSTVPIISTLATVPTTLDLDLDTEMPLSPPPAYNLIHETNSALSLPAFTTPLEKSSGTLEATQNTSLHSQTASTPVPQGTSVSTVTQSAGGASRALDQRFLVPTISKSVVAETEECVVFAAADYAETDSEEDGCLESVIPERQQIDRGSRSSYRGLEKTVARNLTFVMDDIGVWCVGINERDNAGPGLESCSSHRQQSHGSIAKPEERDVGEPANEWEWHPKPLRLGLGGRHETDISEVEQALAKGRRPSGHSFTSSIYSDDLEYDAVLRRLQQEWADEEVRERMEELKRNRQERATLACLWNFVNETDTDTESEPEISILSDLSLAMAAMIGHASPAPNELDGSLHSMVGVRHCTEAGDAPLQTPANRTDSATAPPFASSTEPRKCNFSSEASASPSTMHKDNTTGRKHGNVEEQKEEEKEETENKEKQVPLQPCSRDTATPTHECSSSTPKDTVPTLAAPAPTAISISTTSPSSPSSLYQTSEAAQKTSSTPLSKTLLFVPSLLTSLFAFTSAPSIPSDAATSDDSPVAATASSSETTVTKTESASASFPSSPLTVTVATTTFALTTTTAVSVSPLSSAGPSTPVQLLSTQKSGPSSLEQDNDTQAQTQAQAQAASNSSSVSSVHIGGQIVDSCKSPAAPSSSSSSPPLFRPPATTSVPSETSETIFSATTKTESTVVQPPTTTATASSYTTAVSPLSNTSDKTVPASAKSDNSPAIDKSADTSVEQNTVLGNDNPVSLVAQPVLSFTEPDTLSPSYSKSSFPPLVVPDSAALPVSTPALLIPQSSSLSPSSLSSVASIEPPSPAFSFCTEELSVRPLTLIAPSSTVDIAPPIPPQSSRRRNMPPPTLVLATETPTSPTAPDTGMSAPFNRPSSFTDMGSPPPLGSSFSRAGTPPCDTPRTPPPPKAALCMGSPDLSNQVSRFSFQSDFNVFSVSTFKPYTTTPKRLSQPLTTHLERPLPSPLSTPHNPLQPLTSAPRSSVVSVLSSGTPESAHTHSLRPFTLPGRNSALRNVTSNEVSYFDFSSSEDESSEDDEPDRSRTLTRLLGARRKSLTTSSTSVPAHARLSIAGISASSSTTTTISTDKRRSNSQNSNASASSLLSGGSESETEGKDKESKGILGKNLGGFAGGWFLSRKAKEERKRRNIKNQIKVLHETGRS